MLQNTDYIYLERIQDIAQRCGAQPSAIVRFAKHFGFNGFHDLKQAFLVDFWRTAGVHGHAYRERVRQLVQRDGNEPTNCAEVAFAFMDGACNSVKHLQRDIQADAIKTAVAHLASAHVLWVVGARRAYPVASYLAYAMQSLPKPIQLVNFTGAMQEGQLRGLRAHDALIAISFAPYAEETVHAAQVAHTLGVPVVAITDAENSPLIPEARVSLLVHESTTSQRH